jgi:hypothetical protein
MKKKISILGISGVLCIIALALYFKGNSIRQPNDTGDMGAEFYLGSKELNMLSHQAINGDAKAAYKIYLSYTVDQDRSKGSHDIEASFWLLTAAKNGDPLAQVTLANAYQNYFKDREQAKYWYEKAAAQGDRNAIISLEKLKISKNGVRNH